MVKIPENPEDWQACWLCPWARHLWDVLTFSVIRRVVTVWSLILNQKVTSTSPCRGILINKWASPKYGKLHFKSTFSHCTPFLSFIAMQVVSASHTVVFCHCALQSPTVLQCNFRISFTCKNKSNESRSFSKES